MNSNRKDIITGLIVILLVIGGVYLFKYLKKDKAITPTPSPASYEFKKDFEDTFKLDIPDNVNSIELKDISGGDSRGIATNNEVLVDASDPEAGYYYEAWLENSDKFVSLGKLQVAKGGWMLEYNGSKYPEYKKIVISLEKANDNKIEKKILEGSF
ncbi:MAG: hypothetical protein WA152_02400 [Microgenomates group bacterium]